MSLKRIASFAIVAFTAAFGPSLSAQDLDFEAYMQLLIARSRAEGVSETTLQRMTDGLTPSQRVIQLDRSQPGTPTRTGYPPLAPYIARHVNAVRIENGRRMHSATYAWHRSIEETFGVPSEILLAIWGHETAYGQVMGGFDLAQALATLAWEGRRRDLFASEFVALMKVADKGYSRDRLRGSWAGAFGNPQFLPSVYLRLAKDGDGDGRADIFSNRADTLASIANYFHDAGWRRGEPWGVRATVPADFEWDAVKTKLVSPVCPRVHERHSQWKTSSEWRSLGVTPLRGIADDVLTSLFQPDGPGTPAYLLTANYRVILEYNCSNYYAMSVGLLADEIAR